MLISIIILNVFLISKINKQDNNILSDDFDKLKYEMNNNNENSIVKINGMIQETMKYVGDMLSSNLKSSIDFQTSNTGEKLRIVEERIKSFSVETEQKLDNIRKTIGFNLQNIQEDNNKKLDEMRSVVEQKLQETLNKRMTESFNLVNQRLQDVYKGLGEMQTLAQGVGDLKKVLTNVKTRGIVGEIQLGAILSEILSPEQYETNIATKPGSRNVVEYAIKLPTEDGSQIYLPIDSKFPGDTYSQLRDAYDSGDKETINICAKNLERVIKSEAKDIRDKYISPPDTTDFAIMFLPFEGLYSEVVNRGLIEVLQKEYQVNIAGPSTMAALLNSLQMGFRTFAIQKRSSEVWNVLGAVKTEFDNFAGILDKTLLRLNQASEELDKLVGVRTRQIQRKLKDVEKIKNSDSPKITHVI